MQGASLDPLKWNFGSLEQYHKYFCAISCSQGTFIFRLSRDPIQRRWAEKSTLYFNGREHGRQLKDISRQLCGSFFEVLVGKVPPGELLGGRCLCIEGRRRLPQPQDASVHLAEGLGLSTLPKRDATDSERRTHILGPKQLFVDSGCSGALVNSQTHVGIYNNRTSVSAQP